MTNLFQRFLIWWTRQRKSFAEGLGDLAGQDIVIARNAAPEAAQRAVRFEQPSAQIEPSGAERCRPWA